MIVPAPKGFKMMDAFDTYPWTITLAFLNILFFFMLFSQPVPQSTKPAAEKSKAEMAAEDSELSGEFIKKAGRYYLEWQNSSQLGHGSLEIQALGSQAVRDVDFIFAIEKWKSKIDPVGFSSWKKEFEVIFKKKDTKPINVFGLSQVENKPLTWLTYQFSHQNAFHLFSNMLLMVLFAAVVETMVGGAMMGVIYLLGGLMGAYFFMNMDSSGLIPMVGASASVTALMGFVAAGSLKKNIEYFYFLSPFPGFYGRIYLSPLWVIPLFLISDLSEMLSDPPGWGSGVAHSAHIGGAFAGLILGLAFKYGVTRKSEDKVTTVQN